MSEKSQALRLINDLLADVRDPDFAWQNKFTFRQVRLNTTTA